ncbi:hypothetical protein [Methanogenium cariaci]|uniref:hypothetical protein n=1 Tax=Methanogenium cariaci TaxID=2197 RepID=UPI000784D56F|nr:hypothetical protein [Methanogenium cariaci]
MKSVRHIYAIAAAAILVLCICMPVSAAGNVSINAGQGSGTGSGGESAGPANASLQDREVQDQERITVRDQERVRVEECSPDEACNATRLRAMVTERNQIYLPGPDGSFPPLMITERAAYAFRAAAPPLTSANAPDLIRLSEEINNSVRYALQNEEQIRSQNQFMVFLFGGGDQASADAMMQHVVQNRIRTEEMNRLIDECGCDPPETAALLREQVQAIEQEQARLKGWRLQKKADEDSLVSSDERYPGRFSLAPSSSLFYSIVSG